MNFHKTSHILSLVEYHDKFHFTTFKNICFKIKYPVAVVSGNSSLQKTSDTYFEYLLKKPWNIP